MSKDGWFELSWMVTLGLLMLPRIIEAFKGKQGGD